MDFENAKPDFMQIYSSEMASRVFVSATRTFLSKYSQSSSGFSIESFSSVSLNFFEVPLKLIILHRFIAASFLRRSLSSSAKI